MSTAPNNDLPQIANAKIQLMQQINNMGGGFNEEKFIGLLRQISGREDGGWDSVIRLPMLSRF